MQASLPTETGKSEPVKTAPPSQAELAAAFPQFEILELIGQGGMGFVFKARQPKIDRFVALKILPASLAADAAFAERFTREGRLLARLNHPNIVAIYDFGISNGFFYLLMEYVDGVNLRQAMKAGRFTPAQALAIVPKICEALQFAHNEGILHRDIKPENILLDTKGRVKIADFGIAKLVGERATDATLTTSGATLGTPHYMAPEQLEQPQNVDQRADIYSLGVVFYEMLTGELPIGRFAPPSEKSTVDPRVDEVVLQTLQKERERRTQSAGEVKTQVETIAGSDPQPPARQMHRVPAEQRPNRLRRTLVVGGLALIVILAIVVVGLMARVQRARAQEALARQRNSRLAPASAETWSPAETPTSATLQNVLDQARELMSKGAYEEALQRFIWYHNHSKNDPGQAGVRNSFALSDWIELGRRYPKARKALIEIRDADVAEFAAGRGYFDLFMEASSMNSYLGNEGATLALFKSIDARDKQLAQQCYPIVEPALIERGEYAICLKYIGSPQARFDSSRDSWERSRKSSEQQKALWQQNLDRWRQLGKTNSTFTSLQPPPPPDLSKFADKNFVTQTRQLIQILVASGSKVEAEKIRNQALALVDTPELMSAVSDAEEKISK